MLNTVYGDNFLNKTVLFNLLSVYARSVNTARTMRDQDVLQPPVTIKTSNVCSTFCFWSFDRRMVDKTDEELNFSGL